MDGQGRIFIYSKRGIAAGEELSYDYKVQSAIRFNTAIFLTAGLLEAAA